MPFYTRLGSIPSKRHTVFERTGAPAGGPTIHFEELTGNRGFVGIQSLLYHLNRPTEIRDPVWLGQIELLAEDDHTLRNRHFFAGRVTTGASATLDRKRLLFNGDVRIGLVCPTKADDFFFRNGQADELFYISDGAGVLTSVFGHLRYKKGDYLVVPRGVLYRLVPDEGVAQRYLTVESVGHIRTPKRYRNDHGQLLEHSPFCERDIRVPDQLETRDERGEFPLVVLQRDVFTGYTMLHHPYDVAGWDGYYFPWAFNIADFEPITGRIHQPPPVHQTFEGDGFVVCSFVPRLYDYHPKAIPAPYAHANVDSDEVLYYASAEFMSRKGIEYGSITLHPDGLTHGPQPGRYEASIGKTETNELAVMIDTFRPLTVGREALTVEDKGYVHSWL